MELLSVQRKAANGESDKAKVVNLLQEKLEAQEASDESTDMSESEHLDKLFDFFLYKASNNTCQWLCYNDFWKFRRPKASNANYFYYCLTFQIMNWKISLFDLSITLQCLQAQWSNERSLKSKT